MGKAHEPNVQRNHVEPRREVGELTPDGGDTPERSAEAKRTDLTQPNINPRRNKARQPRAAKGIKKRAA